MNDIDKSELGHELKLALKDLKKNNLHITGKKRTAIRNQPKRRTHKLQKVLIANRGEIAKRFFLSLHEEGISSVAVVTDADKGQSWYDFADEVVFIGDHGNYSNPYVIVAAAQLIRANAVYSGYGFLSENSSFVKIIDFINSGENRKIIFMGPAYGAMHLMGDKISARRIAMENGIPLFKSTDVFVSKNIAAVKNETAKTGYPVIIKLTAGGGGKGMFTVYSEEGIESAVDSCIRAGLSLYNNPSFYIEKYIVKPIHIEVQIFNGWVIGIRKCAVQRRNQKIIEESGELFLDDLMYDSMISIAEKIAVLSGYSDGCGAGTIEFLIDQESGELGFLEMNTRLQVEYAVTDQSLDIDLVKCQIQLYDGREDELNHLQNLDRNKIKRNHAIECRIYAEDPENNYHPSPGIISELVLPTFNGIRCDFGFKEGDRILSIYDPMIGKLIVHGRTRNEALIRLERALQELYIKGVKTNVPQLLRIIRHREFIEGNYNNNFLSDNNDLNPGFLAGGVSDREGNVHIIIGAFVEYLRLLNLNVSEFIVISRIKSIINAPLPDICSDFIVEYRGCSSDIKILQTSSDTFHSFINREYAGSIKLNFSNDQADNIIVNSGNQLLRIRVDRKSDLISLRMKDDYNKIHYYNMKVNGAGASLKKSAGVVRSPFQGTIVSFCKNFNPGDKVSAGEPLIILSSMKMETTIYAQADGEILYIISGEDNSGYAGEKKLGRSIQEGEILFKIEEQSRNIETGYGVNEKRSLKIFSKGFESAVIENPEKYINIICEVYFAIICGYISHENIIEMIQRIIVGIKFNKWNTLLTDSLKDILEKGLLHYAYIKKLFSSSVAAEGVSFYDELSTLVMHWNEREVPISDGFNSLLKKILTSYGYSDNIDIVMKQDNIEFEKLVIYLRFSHQFISDHPEFIKYLIYLLPHLNVSNNRITGIFPYNEPGGIEDFFAKQIEKTLYDEPEYFSRLYHADDSTGIPEGENHSTGTEKLLTSLDNPEADLIPRDIGEFQRSGIEKKINMLKRKYSIVRLHSPVPGVLVYRLILFENGDSGYVAFPLAGAESISQSGICRMIEKMISDAVNTMLLYQAVCPGVYNWIHLIIPDAVISLDGSESDGDRTLISYLKIKHVCSSALNRLIDNSLLRGILECSVRSGNHDSQSTKQLLFYKDNGRTGFEFLQDTDALNPYSEPSGQKDADQRLFKLRKWPVEIWAGECFDSGIFNEVKIKSIDYTEDASADAGSINPVGAKIYKGKINGKDVCFFMKDSRINSGSTGNLEGLKYVAASYLSTLMGWPFFVWNDGAGANIKEGIIALNRGAEGFMMNTLQTGKNHDDFKQFTLHNPDPVLRSLFKTIDGQFGISCSDVEKHSRPLSLVAVGIGSSAGLDVYGSSQAVIQLMLDHDQSYRVLTGSNVIKAIIGEEISNYDIGGAEVICKQTGIADMMAADKIDLICSIRRIHKYFYIENHPVPVKRVDSTTFNAVPEFNDILVLNEEMIRRNVDDGEFIELKKVYNESDSLLGGFAKICGQRVLIIGARTHNGLRSFEPVMKARELLKIAGRTESHQIIIFGKEWIQSETGSDDNFIYKHDFMNTLQKRSGLRIHIITQADGLKLFYINNTADIIIFIENDKDKIAESSLIWKSSTFVVSTFDEAFDLSHKLFDMLTPSGLKDVILPSGVPCIPSDHSTPFDMITSVINAVYDADSFIEFYREMNNSKTGPMLITGVALLNGATVGIIADQPLQKGGAADAYGTEKFRIFTELLNRWNIPCFMLSNSSGFMPGSQQESLRIQAIGAESLDANIAGKIPVVSIVFNQNYGGRLIHSFNKFLRPGIVYLAFEESILAVIGVHVAFELLNRKKYDKLVKEGKTQEAENFKDRFYSDYMNKSKASSDGTGSSLVDWIIPDITELRVHMIKALDIARKRCREAFQ